MNRNDLRRLAWHRALHRSRDGSCPARVLEAGAFLALTLAALTGLAMPTVHASSDPMPPTSRQHPDARQQALLDAVRADAARRSGRPAEHLIVSSFEAVTWPDGALGCPEPDRVYTQALVPGYRIVVRAGDDDLVYHASERGHWVWCPPGRAGAPIQRSI